MLIREIMHTDLYGLLELYTHLNDNTMPEPGETLMNMWDAMLQQKDMHVIVAEEEGRLISTCTMILIPNLTHEQRPFALLENVVTHEQFRNRGAAAACLDFARQIAIEHNCHKLMLTTGTQKESTKRFYRSAGYRSDGVTAFVQKL